MSRNHLKRLRDAVFNEYLNLPGDIRQSTDNPLRRILSIGDRINAGIQKRKPAGKAHLRKRVVGEATSISDVLIHDVAGTPRSRRSQPKKLVTRRKSK